MMIDYEFLYRREMQRRMTLEARVERLTGLLKSYEWIDSENGLYCEKCDYYKSDGHAPNCALLAVLPQLQPKLDIMI